MYSCYLVQKPHWRSLRNKNGLVMHIHQIYQNLSILYPHQPIWHQNTFTIQQRGSSLHNTNIPFLLYHLLHTSGISFHFSIHDIYWLRLYRHSFCKTDSQNPHPQPLTICRYTAVPYQEMAPWRSQCSIIILASKSSPRMADVAPNSATTNSWAINLSPISRSTCTWPYTFKPDPSASTNDCSTGFNRSELSFKNVS